MSEVKKVPFKEKLKALYEENPVKFFAAIEGAVGSLAGTLALFGLTLVAGVITGIVAASTALIGFWTQNNKTVPAYRADEYRDPVEPLPEGEVEPLPEGDVPELDESDIAVDPDGREVVDPADIEVIDIEVE